VQNPLKNLGQNTPKFHKNHPVFLFPEKTLKTRGVFIKFPPCLLPPGSQAAACRRQGRRSRRRPGWPRRPWTPIKARRRQGRSPISPPLPFSPLPWSLSETLAPAISLSPPLPASPRPADTATSSARTSPSSSAHARKKGSPLPPESSPFPSSGRRL
jgi:hypothetical protein